MPAPPADPRRKEVTVAGSGGGQISLTVNGVISGNHPYALLAWSGATYTSVDVYRNGTKVVTTPVNDGAYTIRCGRLKAPIIPGVREAGTSLCSNEDSVTF